MFQDLDYIVFLKNINTNTCNKFSCIEGDRGNIVRVLLLNKEAQLDLRKHFQDTLIHLKIEQFSNDKNLSRFTKIHSWI